MQELLELNMGVTVREYHHALQMRSTLVMTVEKGVAPLMQCSKVAPQMRCQEVAPFEF